MKDAEKQEIMVYTQEKKQLVKIVLDKAHMLELLDKSFNSAMWNMFKELKETIPLGN